METFAGEGSGYGGEGDGDGSVKGGVYMIGRKGCKILYSAALQLMPMAGQTQ